MRSRRLFYMQVVFFLFSFCIGILVLLKFTTDLKKTSSELSGEIKARGAAIIDRFRITGFRQPSPGDHLVFDPREKAEGRLFISSIGCFFGSKEQWQVPREVPLPAFSEPPRGFPNVAVISGSQRLFLARLEDGRTLAILFETPRYRSERRQTVTISTFLAILVLLGMGLVSYSIRRFGVTDADQPAPRQGREIGPFDAVEMMKKTVSELKEKNRELQDKLGKEKLKARGSAAVLESLSSGLNAGFLRFDPAGRLQGLNPNANRLLGLPVLLTIGDGHDKIFKDRPALKDLVDEAISQKAILAAEAIEGLGGKLLLVLTIPLLDDLDHFEGLLLIIHDRSSYYAMERAVREKEELTRLGEVAAGVAHEIRNGLNVLSGELRLLKKESGGDAGARIGRIEGEIGQMERVVRDLLYFSKPLSLEKESVPIREFTEDLLSSAANLFPGTKFSSEADDGEFTADQDSIFRAILNVVSNAAEAAGDGGEVFVSAVSGENLAVFRVEDSGGGVSQEAGKDLFGLFATHKKGGTGLGLPIARKIAREHGGEISLVKSVKLMGACFEFKIPR